MKKLLILTVLSFWIVGCGSGGGGSSSLPKIDNSKLTLLENDYGYFGENVQLADYTASRGWDLYPKQDSDLMWLSLRNDGEMTLQNMKTNKNQRLDYGISKDGLQIRTKTRFIKKHTTFTITSTSSNSHTVMYPDGKEEKFKCYNMTFESWDIGTLKYEMCPAG